MIWVRRIGESLPTSGKCLERTKTESTENQRSSTRDKRARDPRNRRSAVGSDVYSDLPHPIDDTMRDQEDACRYLAADLFTDYRTSDPSVVARGLELTRFDGHLP